MFFGEQGPVDYVTHAGALFAVNADGSDLEQLSPDGVHLALVRGRPASLSPAGDRVAFAGFVGHPDDEQSAVYVASIDGGIAERITEPSGGIWSAAWAPVGERIAYAHWWSESWVSVVNADGSDQRDITDAATEEAGFGVWSPDGEFLLAQSVRRMRAISGSSTSRATGSPRLPMSWRDTTCTPGVRRVTE